MTAELALGRYGMTWNGLERLATRAARDRLTRNRQYLDDERMRRVVEHLVDVGIEWARRYDVEKANGVSFSTSCYRRMYARVPDPLRAISGDPRRGTPLVEIVTDTLAEQQTMDEETFLQLLDHVEAGLSPRAAATLRTVGWDMFVLGLERWEIAARHEIEPPSMITDLLEEVGHQLRHTLVAA